VRYTLHRFGQSAPFTLSLCRTDLQLHCMADVRRKATVTRNILGIEAALHRCAEQTEIRHQPVQVVCDAPNGRLPADAIDPAWVYLDQAA
jgi:hypothetical protein